MKKEKDKVTKILVKGFFRGQLVNSETGKIEGDTGWRQNKLTNEGLQNLAKLLGGQAGSYVVGFAALGTQNTAVDMSQTDLVGRTHSFKALNLSTSGSATLTCTTSFGSASLSASCSVAAVGLYASAQAGSMIACQTFATSSWNTNQDFNLTYQIRFATA